MSIDQPEEEKMIQKHLARLFQDVFGVEGKRIQAELRGPDIMVHLAEGVFPNAEGVFPNGVWGFQTSMGATVGDWAYASERIDQGDTLPQYREKERRWMEREIIETIEKETGLKAKQTKQTMHRIGF
ncbi:MAG: hypothetical protein HYY21_08565 [Candidatus Tectomicrobia bacterium]|nr:hypothetical protein [Candidatus Tectomicrobia bacterium]